MKKYIGSFILILLIASAGFGLGLQYFVDRYCDLLDSLIERLAVWLEMDKR